MNPQTKKIKNDKAEILMIFTDININTIAKILDQIKTVTAIGVQHEMRSGIGIF